MIVYLQLIWIFLKIGLFGFGGGVSMIPLIQHDLVEVYGWLTMEEFTNMIAISQMTPGPIGINCATYAGYLATGNVFGALIATLSLIFPSCIIIALIIKVLDKFKQNPYVEGAMQGLRPAVIGLLAAACLIMVDEKSFGPRCADWLSWTIFAVSFILVKWLKVNPITLMIGVAVFGIFVYV